jgi:hypothetical protein
VQTDFTVTGDQVLDYSISSISVQNIEEGSPLDVSLTVINVGNVKAKPTKVKVEIYDKLNTDLLESKEVSEMGSVDAFLTGDITFSVPTKQKLGQYWTRIIAYRDKDILKEDRLVFEIVEVGSLKKKGDLKEIIINKTAEVGETVKITGVFENTGLANYSAKLVSEVFKQDKLVKMVESELATVTIGQTENLLAYFTPSENGKYTIKSRVAYSGGKTAEKPATLTVGNTGVLGQLTPVVAGGILLVIIIIVILAIVSRKKSSARSRVSNNK